MKYFNNYNLKKYNTLQLDSIAEIFYEPENEGELIDLFASFSNPKQKFYILGNGSNILLNNSNIIKTPVIYMGKVNEEITYNNEDSTFTVGCSVPIQKFINTAMEHNYGGIEYLYSVPGQIGGCICMNAGRGKKSNLQISDFVTSVKIFDGEKIRMLSDDECEFSYRNSKIKKENWIIISANFKLKSQDKSTTENLIKERIKFTKAYQDHQYPNAGSIFTNAHPYSWLFLKGLSFGGAAFSKKTANWLQNKYNSKYSDIIKLIVVAKLVNIMFLRKLELELVTFE